MRVSSGNQVAQIFSPLKSVVSITSCVLGWSKRMKWISQKSVKRFKVFLQADSVGVTSSFAWIITSIHTKTGYEGQTRSSRSTVDRLTFFGELQVHTSCSETDHDLETILIIFTYIPTLFKKSSGLSNIKLDWYTTQIPDSGLQYEWIHYKTWKSAFALQCIVDSGL